mgnify:CR=1 FL=1
MTDDDSGDDAASGAGIPDAGISGDGDRLLAVDGLRKTFGGLAAVDGASFDVEAGTITGLIGPNGAGKSTTFDCLTGFHEPDGGHVVFDGEDVTGMAPYAVADRGLVRTFQIARELGGMTVLENLMLAPRGQRGESALRSVLPGAWGRGGVREQETALRERVWATLDRFDLDHLAREPAANLSGGQLKLLELARALLVDPTMLLLDEPFAGVNPTLERRLLDRLHALRDDGLTMLLVEHDVELVMAHCDRVIVMHRGDVLAEGPPEEVRDDARVIEAYLGGEV